jgi:hypothetical protein
MPRLPRIDRTRALFAMVVAIGVGLIVWGLQTGVSGDRAITSAKPLAIDRLIPNPGEIVLRQSQIGVDLANGYRGALTIDGQDIPTYDLVASGARCSPNTQSFTGKDSVFDPGEGTLYFQPTPGSTIEKFAPGSHRITVRFWKLCDSPDLATAFTWTFKVS